MSTYLEEYNRRVSDANARLGADREVMGPQRIEMLEHLSSGNVWTYLPLSPLKPPRRLAKIGEKFRQRDPSYRFEVKLAQIALLRPGDNDGPIKFRIVAAQADNESGDYTVFNLDKEGALKSAWITRLHGISEVAGGTAEEPKQSLQLMVSVQPLALEISPREDQRVKIERLLNAVMNALVHRAEFRSHNAGDAPSLQLAATINAPSIPVQ